VTYKIIWSASTPNNTSPNPSSRSTNCSAGETVVDVELVELVVVLSGATDVVIGARVVSGIVVAVVGKGARVSLDPPPPPQATSAVNAPIAIPKRIE
jgi:hypothetical protein